MRTPKWRQLLAQLEREEFDTWFVAYHELHLDGSRHTAAIENALHNEVGPMHAYLGIEWQPTQAKDYLPDTEFVVGKSRKEPETTSNDEPDLESLFRRAWGI